MCTKKPIVCIVIAVVASFTSTVWSQEAMTTHERLQAQQMLARIAADVREHYYDPALHGVDWDATVAQEKQKIEKAETIEKAFLSIDATLETLNDPNTVFLPPARTYSYDYGWQIEMIGDHCYVTQVELKSGAEVKGMRPGDEVLSIDGFIPTRDSLWKL